MVTFGDLIPTSSISYICAGMEISTVRLANGPDGYSVPRPETPHRGPADLLAAEVVLHRSGMCREVLVAWSAPSTGPIQRLHPRPLPSFQARET